MDINLPQVFEESSVDSRLIVREKRRVAKNFSWTRVRSLENAMLLGYWFYILGRTEDALEVSRFLAQGQFNGNLELWGWIQSSLILQSRILKMQGSNAEANDCMLRVRSTGDDDYRLDGKVLNAYERNVDAALDDATSSSKPSEIAWRVMVLMELFFLIEVNASPTLPTQLLKEKVANNLKRLESLAGIP